MRLPLPRELAAEFAEALGDDDTARVLAWAREMDDMPPPVTLAALEAFWRAQFERRWPAIKITR